MEKTFDAKTAEAEIADLWDAAGAFAAGANAKPGGEPFTILLPPPNVTGSLHMGHAFNHTLMDILARWHRMKGDDVLWQPGLDHAGIATQMVVERQLAAAKAPSRREMGRAAFTAKVWEWKGKSGGTILDQCRRLGDSFDLTRNAFTMSGAPGAPAGEDGNFHDAVLKAFVALYDKGLIYRGKRLVNWDPHFETAISDLEVEQVEEKGSLWRLRYPLENGATYEHPVEFDAEGKPTAYETRDYLVVATTRPETMLGDTGVAVNPKDPRYTHLVGNTVRLPLVGRSVPIVADDYADPEKGTGAVKITPAHDFNDWEVGRRAGLRVINVMGTRGQIALRENEDFWDGIEITEELAGLDGIDRYEVRDAIVTMARDEGWLDGIDSETHMVPHGDRSKVAIEPFLTDQWFVKTEGLAEKAMEAVRSGRTRILPERDEKTYFHWMENIEPWCISRQLWWGHQIPVWYGDYVDAEGRFPHRAGGVPAADEPAVFHDQGRFVRAFCAAGPDAAREDAENWYRARIGHRVIVRFEGEDPEEAEALPEEPETTFITLRRDPDVLDTWFSSGIWPIGTLGWPERTPELAKYFPTSVLVTGFDIIFFWVARMMMMQLELVDEVPFRDVYVHALVRDEKGKKMSKSLGNVLDPIELIDEFGADAVRFTLTAMAAMGRDLKLSKDRIAGYRNFGTKLWNAARFAEMNECRPVPGFDPKSVTLTANKWIVGETGRVREELDAALAAYRFNDAANALYAFVWGKVCDWYVELAKPLFQDEAAVAETRATMAWVIDQCLILMHPIMPFITESLWGQIAERPKLLVHGDWPEYGADLIDAAADAEMGWITGLIDEIRSVRAQMHVPAGARITLIELSLSQGQAEALERNRPLVARLARIERFETAAEAPKGAVTIARDGGSFCLPLADVIDIAAERERLAKAMAKLDKEADGLRKKLANEKFIANAKEEVVDEARANLEAKEEELAILRDAQARLAAL
ncbi:valine--tRNA ligase [Amaricoccus solimangrovi]|uniref:Valine--tRNA ligase n=1 Tax=Amaricoccus solimangrovi TaxID=2589815 RepID=A0A501WXF9_9RHOB|nr:valine--tRNA ligase [Amaricoccus solimangrovi]TPE53140.1 valine--tRNA ligase [Amaricoccus solimangrovi]